MNLLAEYGPQNIDQAWAYFKHWVKGRPIAEATCLHDGRNDNDFDRAPIGTVPPASFYNNNAPMYPGQRRVPNQADFGLPNRKPGVQSDDGSIGGRNNETSLEEMREIDEDARSARSAPARLEGNIVGGMIGPYSDWAVVDRLLNVAEEASSTTGTLHTALTSSDPGIIRRGFRQGYQAMVGLLANLRLNNDYLADLPPGPRPSPPPSEVSATPDSITPSESASNVMLRLDADVNRLADEIAGLARDTLGPALAEQVVSNVPAGVTASDLAELAQLEEDLRTELSIAEQTIRARSTSATQSAVSERTPRWLTEAAEQVTSDPRPIGQTWLATQEQRIAAADLSAASSAANSAASFRSSAVESNNRTLSNNPIINAGMDAMKIISRLGGARTRRARRPANPEVTVAPLIANPNL